MLSKFSRPYFERVGSKVSRNAVDRTACPAGATQVTRKNNSRASSLVDMKVPFSGRLVLSNLSIGPNSLAWTFPDASTMWPFTSANVPGPAAPIWQSKARGCSTPLTTETVGSGLTEMFSPLPLTASRARRTCLLATISVAAATSKATREIRRDAVFIVANTRRQPRETG